MAIKRMYHMTDAEKMAKLRRVIGEAIIFFRNKRLVTAGKLFILSERVRWLESIHENERPLDMFDFSIRVQRSLYHAGIKNIGQLLSTDDDQVRKIYGIGPKSMREIEEFLKSKKWLVHRGSNNPHQE